MAGRHKPLIGITGPNHGGTAAWLAAAWAVRRAGGRPIRITPDRRVDAGRLDGLVIGGGADVSPMLYGEPATETDDDAPYPPVVRPLRERMALWLLAPALHLLRRLLSTFHAPRTDGDRDSLELSLLKHAGHRSLPVLGICRGAQLINVSLGGSLYQELGEFYVERPQLRTLLPVKEVSLAPDSRLAAVMACTEARVNALHYQAVRELGDGLVAVALERTGVVQAIEHPQRAYCIGVQWHPEYLPHRPEQFRLFQTLIAVAET